jgi:hypothetical protein
MTIKPTETHWDETWDEFDWDGWLKPGIDLGHARGYNCFCIMGGVNGLPFAMNRYTQETFNSRLTQMIDYLASLDMYVVMVAGGRGSWDNTGANPQITSLQWTTYVASVVDVLADYQGVVVGLDVDLEVNAHTNEGAAQAPSFSWASIKTDFDTVKTYCDTAAPWLPLTMSNSVTPSGSGFQATFAADLANRVDFWDWHIYSGDPAAGYMNPVYAAGGAKPFLIGEFGVNQGQSGAVRIARVNAILRNVVARDPLCMGALQWCTFDQEVPTSGQWGIWDNPVDQTYRTDVADVFDTFPKAG